VNSPLPIPAVPESWGCRGCGGPARHTWSGPHGAIYEDAGYVYQTYRHGFVCASHPPCTMEAPVRGKRGYELVRVPTTTYIVQVWKGDRWTDEYPGWKDEYKAPTKDAA
jgi:hypothetical protein